MKQTIRKSLIPNLYLIPTWCDRLSVSFDPAMGHEAVAHTKADVGYREAAICVGAHFLNGNAQARRKYLVHELYHILSWAPWETAMELLEQLAISDESKRLFEHCVRRDYEGTVCDATRMLLRFPANHKTDIAFTELDSL